MAGVKKQEVWFDDFERDPFTHSNLALMLLLCQLSYKDPETIEDHAPRFGLTNARFHQVNMSKMFVAEDDQAVYVIFRGTDELAQWDSNLSMERSHFELGGKMHRGFSAPVGELWNTIQREISPRLMQIGTRTPKKLVISGHSLGGAMAQVMLGRMLYEQPVLAHHMRVFTYASPRVFSEIAAEFVRQKTEDHHVGMVHIEHVGDPLVWMPPYMPRLGGGVYFKNDGKLSL